MVVCIAKVTDVGHAGDVRPITVFNMLYRIFSRIRTRAFLDWFSSFAPKELLSYLAGKDPSDDWLPLALRTEHAIGGEEGLVGGVFDIVNSSKWSQMEA